VGNQALFRFAGTRPGELLLIDLNGTVTTLSNQEGKLALSPDPKWLLYYNDQQMELFAEPERAK